MIWFSSDWHLCHSNICRGSSRWPDTSECRDFDNAHFMNKTILENVNSMVAPNDILVIAGGVIPPHDYKFLYDAGVAAIFGPGTSVAKAARQILEILMHVFE